MTTTPTHCLDCNAPLSPADAQGLCPRCLLKAGLATQHIGGSVGGAGARTLVAPPEFPFDFGGYRVLRLLGRGGMGAVYEGEQRDTGRRVALKVLGHTIDSPEMRARFMREGRLAASVNHPNSVYIFGTEEIEGAPVIAMELVAGGTLRDRIRKGPLPVREAVDAILQIIAGLEAAANAGVLHRDVKPANCFVAPDGTAKVGDFGLSVSTLARSDTQLTASGMMLGTPSYAPPEQLRGDELDVRADIYSVGATLYSLLTGRAPFEGDNAVQVVAAVLDKTPPPVAKVPTALAQIVARCLAKKREDRFADYDALRDALLPFSSEAREPAPIGLRTVAGIIDCLLATFISMVILAHTGGSEEVRFLSERSLAATLEFFGVMLVGVAYFAIPEGLWGASLGKMLCGLRVAGMGRAAPGIPVAALRAGIVMLTLNVAVFIQLLISSAEEVKQMALRGDAAFYDIAGPSFMFLLFVTMRRRNGFAAIHDTLTDTRVIVCPKSSERPRLEVAAVESPSTDENAERIGPFRVVAPIAGAWLSGYDEVLRRRVWIRKCDAGSAAISPTRRDLGRVGRLRWIAGARCEDGGWDAFDAPTGRPLREVSAQSWSVARWCLLDLAEELDAAKEDGTLPGAIGLDHVWITADGRALLLDEPWARSEAMPQFDCSDVAGAQRFLAAAADAGLDRARLPLHAHDFLNKLAAAAFDRASFVSGNLRSLLAKPAAISRRRRFASLALAPGLALAVGLPIGVFMHLEHRRENVRWAGHTELRTLPEAVAFHGQLNGENPLMAPAMAMGGMSQSVMDDLSSKTAKYIAGNFGKFIASAEFDQPPFSTQWNEQERAAVRELVRTQPPVPAAELASIDAVLKPIFTQQITQHERVPYAIPLGLLGFALVVMCVTQFLSLLIFRTTLGQRLFGFAVVNKRGELAGRGRMLLRWAAIWLPLGLLAVRFGMTASGIGAMTTGALILFWVKPILYLACLVFAVVRPERGMHDEMAGTRVVPR